MNSLAFTRSSFCTFLFSFLLFFSHSLEVNFFLILFACFFLLPLHSEFPSFFYIFILVFFVFFFFHLCISVPLYVFYSVYICCCYSTSLFQVQHWISVFFSFVYAHIQFFSNSTITCFYFFQMPFCRLSAFWLSIRNAFV